MSHRYEVFVSYAEADRDWVEGHLLATLDVAGVRYQRLSVGLGAPRLVEFERAVRESDKILLVLSPAYLAADYGEFTELLTQTYGLETATWPVIAIVLGKVELPPHLSFLKGLDATDLADLRRRLGVLSEVLLRPKPGAALPAPEWPVRPDAGEGVAFTAAYPGIASPHLWYSLSVYLHLGRLQAEVDELITRRSPQFGLSPAVSRTAPFASLLRGTALRVIPEVQGVVFNPPSQDVTWLEELQEVSFRLQAGSDAADRTLLGAVTVHAGPLLVTQIPLSIRVRGAGEREEHIEGLASTTTPLFSSIFASYAHKDDRVVRAFAEAYRALGIDMIVDKVSLRAGERWQERLLLLIEEADLFQLFWSDTASRSRAVADEWRHALSLQSRKGERFIRPVYWRSPWPQPPAQLAHLHFAFLDLAALSSITDR